MIDKQRLIWVDALKGILMILVVLGHAIQTELGASCEESHLWNLIYSFHMPAFMAVSGWLFYKKPTGSVSNICGGVFKFLYKTWLSIVSAVFDMVTSCFPFEGYIYSGEILQYSLYAG